MLALASKRSGPTSTVTRGFTRRVRYQSGFVGAAPVAGVDKRIRPRASGFRPARGQKQNRAPGERTSGDLAVVGAEVFYDPFVEPAEGTGPTLVAHRPGNNDFATAIPRCL